MINIASVAANRPWPAQAAYAASKSGVVSLTQVLAQEWGEAGVRVNVICPGWVMTDINREFLADERAAAIATDSVPLARVGQTDDITGAAIWLASDSSGYVTGANIAIDGGLASAVSEDWRAARTEQGCATRGLVTATIASGPASADGERLPAERRGALMGR